MALDDDELAGTDYPAAISPIVKLTKKESSQVKILTKVLGPIRPPGASVAPVAPAHAMNSPQKGLLRAKASVELAKAALDRAKTASEKTLMLERAIGGPNFEEFDEETRVKIKRRYSDLLLSE